MCHQWLRDSITKKMEHFMSKLFNYNSIYAPYFKSFIKMKKDKGYNVLRTEWIFLEFDKFFSSIEAKELYITMNVIEQWRIPASMTHSELFIQNIPSGPNSVN